MRRKHRLLTILLALALLLGMAALPAAADAGDISATEKADILYAWGLFKGTEIKEDGTPEYALGDTANRAAAATMLIRLLGKENKAAAQYAAGAVSSPFTDLGWEAATVTWLYANNLANGMDDTTFGGTSSISAQQFATFILRALGYSDSGSAPDFTYNQALDFAVRKQVITEAQRTAFQADFRREGMVEMCYNALYLEVNGSSQTLLEKLTSDGVFKDSYKNNAYAADTAAVTLTPKYTGGGTANPTYMDEQCLGNALCEDVDGDGWYEIIFGVRAIICADAATGTREWAIPEDRTGGQAENGRAPFQILDFDGDGRRELFAVTFANTKVTVNIIDFAAKDIKAQWSVNLYHNIWSVYPADLDGDGQYEVIIGAGVGSTGADAVYVYNGDGSLRWSRPLGYGLYSNSIVAVDLDYDGVKEIVLTYDETQIVAFRADGSKVNAAAFGTTWDQLNFYEGVDSTGYEFDSRESQYGIMGTKSSIIADDLDGNGTLEIIGVSMIDDIQVTADRMASGTGTTFAGAAKYFGPYIINLDRTRYKNEAKGFDWSHIPTDNGAILVLNGEDPNDTSKKYNIAEPDLRPLTVDIDGDGNKEILYSSHDGQVHCFNLDGTEHGAWPFALNGRTTSVISMASRPAAADINGDGKLEVIFATYTPMDQTEVRGKLYVLDYTGKKLAEETLPPMFYTDVDTYANGSRTAPVVADIDNDGLMEIVVATYNCGLVAYDIG